MNKTEDRTERQKAFDKSRIHGKTELIKVMYQCLEELMGNDEVRDATPMSDFLGATYLYEIARLVSGGMSIKKAQRQADKKMSFAKRMADALTETNGVGE